MRAFRIALFALAAGAALTLPLQARAQSAKAEPRFLHHVFFWLADPHSAGDKAKLIAALERLSSVATIRSYQIGEPAGTDRDVIDGSYSVSWTLAFDSAEDQASYQVDPIHLKFVEESSPLWSRVLVYDTVPAKR